MKSHVRNIKHPNNSSSLYEVSFTITNYHRTGANPYPGEITSVSHITRYERLLINEVEKFGIPYAYRLKCERRRRLLHDDV